LVLDPNYVDFELVPLQPSLGLPFILMAKSGTQKGDDKSESGGQSGGVGPVNLGKAGEEAAGITARKESIKVPSSGRTRRPDELTETMLREVKNVAEQAKTSQMRDYLEIAEKTGRQFQLDVRTSTKISGPLQALIDAGKIILRRILK
jgi:hypothetical protein